MSTGIGRDILPRTDGEVAFTVVVTIWGMLMYASIIGAITSAVSVLDASGIERSQKLERVPGQDKSAKFPTSKAPISAVFHSFRLIFGRAIISRNGLEAWMLFPERARAEHSR